MPIEDAVGAEIDPRPEIKHVVDLPDPGPALEVRPVVLAGERSLQVLALVPFERVDPFARSPEDLDRLVVRSQMIVKLVDSVVDDRIDDTL